LARIVAAELSNGYQVRLTAPVKLKTRSEFIESSLNRDRLTNLVVQGVDAIVHVALPLLGVGQPERIDYRTRCTYNLLRAAADEDVRNVVYLSSLDVMAGCDQRFEVDEEWSPSPTVASAAMSSHLGEFICREFAREGSLNVVILRLGNVVQAEALPRTGLDSVWVDPRDVAQAVSRALNGLLAGTIAGRPAWSVFHIQSGSPQARFSIRKAKRLLGYQPQFGGPE
jgi:nucleoside-diphosphate-sugar epimerase